MFGLTRSGTGPPPLPLRTASFSKSDSPVLSVDMVGAPLVRANAPKVLLIRFGAQGNSGLRSLPPNIMGPPWWYQHRDGPLFPAHDGNSCAQRDYRSDNGRLGAIIGPG